MDFKKYIEKISLQPQAAELFWRLHSRSTDVAFEKRIAESFAAYDAGDEAFGAYLQDFAAAEGVRPEEINLYVFLRLSERTWNHYQQKGVGEDVFYESMYSMTVCCQVCYDRHGIYGIDQDVYRRWQRYVLDGTLFRLGRLEFQLKEMDMDVLEEDNFVKLGEILMDKKGVTMFNIPMIEKINAPTEKMATLQKSIDLFQKWLIEVLLGDEELNEIKEEAKRYVAEKEGIEINEEEDIKKDE